MTNVITRKDVKVYINDLSFDSCGVQRPDLNIGNRSLPDDYYRYCTHVQSHDSYTEDQ